MTRYQIALKKPVPRLRKKKQEKPAGEQPNSTLDYKLLAGAPETVVYGLQTILAAVRRIHELRPQMAPYYENIGLQYKKEHATIQFHLPRRSGNTSLAIELSRIFPNTYVVFNNNNMLDEFRRQILDLERPLPLCGTVSSRDFLYRGDGGWTHVIADGASVFTREEMDRFYQLTSEVYILLG